MSIAPSKVLASGAARSRMVQPAHTSVLLVGAIGPLGNAVLRALAGNPRWQPLRLAVRAPLHVTFEGITPVLLGTASAQIAVVVFDHSRAADGREHAIARCAPSQLAALAAQLLASGTKALVVVTPQHEGSLPQALRAGLLNLEEQALAALGFEHLLLIRPAQRSAGGNKTAKKPLERLANALLGTLRLMVPTQEQPVLTHKVAAFVECALRALPHAAPGIYIAGADTLWRSAQHASPFTVAHSWLRVEQSSADSAGVHHLHHNRVKR